MTERSTTLPDRDDAAPAALHVQPLLLVAYHADARHLGKCHVLRPGETIVGRGASTFGADALEDPLLSRKHLAFERRGEDVYARDLASRNGTTLNGAQLTAPSRLAQGDRLAAGGVVLVYTLGPIYHEPPRHASLVGVSPAMAALAKRVAQLAPGDATVLIQGESGTGKELVARALHAESGRAGAFVPVNCAALSDGVVHAELFGHVRGAFSGAEREREGLVRAAQGGTLFLDEIGDASPALQASLLRLLESREYRPVGSDRLEHADLRFLAATHVPLSVAVEQQRFRLDLFTRVSRMLVEVPALRERRADVVVTALHLAARARGRAVSIARPLALALLEHDWPGNVRELDALVHEALTTSPETDCLELDDALLRRLRPNARSPERSARTPRPPGPRPRIDRPGPQALRALLAEHGGNIRALAHGLGVGRGTVYRWLRDAGIEVEEHRRK